MLKRNAQNLTSHTWRANPIAKVYQKSTRQHVGYVDIRTTVQVERLESVVNKGVLRSWMQAILRSSAAHDGAWYLDQLHAVH